MRAAHRFEHRVPVERRQGAEIDDLEVDALAREPCGRLERTAHHRAVRVSNVAVVPVATRGLADGHDEIRVERYLALDPAEALDAVDR